MREVRLQSRAGGGVQNFSYGSTLALAVSLGKRLVVVDVGRDSVAVSVRLPAPAWSCAWGGWDHPLSAEVAAACATPSSSTSDPASDPNLVSVGLSNGGNGARRLRIVLAFHPVPSAWFHPEQVV